MFELISLETWLKSSNEYFITNSENYIDESFIPKRSTLKSAGYDFISPFDIKFTCEEIVSEKPKKFILPTGIKWNSDGLPNINEIVPLNVVLELYPRSSLGFKYEFRFLNTIPVIDEDYYNNKSNEGHILLGFTMTLDSNILNNDKVKKEMSDNGNIFTPIKRGDKICQGIITNYLAYNIHDAVNSIRVGGIGSTGN